MERSSSVIALSERAMNIGVAVLRTCPHNDCEVYRNLYTMRMETLDVLEQMEALPAKNWGRETLIREANRLARELERMARTNYAVRNYAAGLQAANKRKW